MPPAVVDKPDSTKASLGHNQPPEEAQMTIEDMVEANPSLVLTDEEKRDEFFASLADQIAGFSANVDTAKGRDEIKSFAFAFRKKKAAIDGAGKEMNEAARKQINVVDAARRLVRDKLDDFVTAARAPLTEWEQAQANRQSAADALIAQFKADAVVPMGDTAAAVRERGKRVYDTEVDRAALGDDLADEVEKVKEYAVGVLKDALRRLTREEADKAELETLRAEAAAREEAERAAREAEEAKQAKRKYASMIIAHIHECGEGRIGGTAYPYAVILRELEEKIVVSEDAFGDMAEEVEKARLATLSQVKKAQAAEQEREQREAAEREAEAARQAAERAAAKAREEAERKHQAELVAERERVAAAERKAQEERDRIQREEEARRAAEEKEEQERQRKAANAAHRRRVKTAAAKAIATCGTDAETADKIVLAIIAGDVPRVSLEF